ncbi:GntR family transcriptional regulator [Actinoplanes lobatus]|uniref:GntR family transcriptional regulator n=1 Tax=Actinoplanes lobatus TaxID=113568 RepID=A0A7W7HJB0_9ACTN|nr:PLP-dependent aminotransferase family protein [Actinoplanes lobatus]MBB4751588.1 GntR family transcriptional regulator/MocR family aminotransferase [Actinoplanes lobatus]GGN64855.1 GntR family transcriptional regulator [Actinoplanes lobatus]GIE43172.1 GntR family transcriptional regulator [Actinoplanes lobatus]
MPDSWVTSLDGPGSRRARLMRALRDAIRSGQLKPDTRLPSYRALSADLGIARNTVAEAYAELVEEGWLTARQGSGTRVAARAAPPAGNRPQQPSAHDRRPVHDLAPSSPDAAAFPRAAWSTSARRALTAAPSEAFGPGDPRGRPELRRALAEYLGRARGVRADADRIVICAGFAGGLRLLAELLPRTVAVEAYGLRFHGQILENAGIRTVPLAVDERGADIATLPGSGAGAVLLTPAHQYPTGGALHAARRTAVVDWARASGGLILEDDYDGEFRYDRQPIGAVQGLDPDRVVYLGSASKSLSPALRLGWMVLPDHLIDDLLAVKGGREFWSGVGDQLTLADFLASGGYDRHLRRRRQTYRRRRDLLVTALQERHPTVRVTGIAAGLHAVLALPPGSEPRVLATARTLGVAVDGLSAYRHPASPMPPRDGLVVGYGTPPEHGFAAAVHALCAALD